MLIVTGASSGLGSQFIQKFSNEIGLLPAIPQILATYHKTEPERLKNVKYEQLNATNETEIENFVLRNAPNLVRPTLVHFAGINHNAKLPNLPKEKWDEVIEVNLTSAYLLVKHLLPLMREQNYGRIIFCSSIVPQTGIIGTAAYASSKSALWGLTKALSKEGASKNVTCNCLNLGYMDGGMTHTEITPTVLKQIIEKIPMQKLGDPQNIVDAVKFLMKADYVTGTCIDINGGLV